MLCLNQNSWGKSMKRAFDVTPKVAYVFGDMTTGGHNLQAYKTIIYSGAVDNCLVISLSRSVENGLEKKLAEVGISVQYCEINKSNYFIGIRSLRSIVENNGCSIAHSNGLRSDLACYLAFKNSETIHVITLHNFLKEDAYLRMNKYKACLALMIQKYVLKRSNHIIACSKTLANQMNQYIPGLNISYIQNGVDLDNFGVMDKNTLRLQYGFPEDELLFISTGSMTKRKRIPETIEAFLSAKLPNSKLLIVGDGTYLKEYRARYSKYDNVEFLGRRNDIKELLNICDVFVSSSESEGLPLAVLEAISTGKIVYLSDIPQHKEIVESLNYGNLYHLGNQKELSSLMNNTVKNSACGINLANTSFDIKVMGEKYKNYYINLISNTKK